jgi:hypothetical protein
VRIDPIMKSSDRKMVVPVASVLGLESI